jgi:hypothetical protein
LAEDVPIKLVGAGGRAGCEMGMVLATLQSRHETRTARSTGCPTLGRLGAWSLGLRLPLAIRLRAGTATATATATATVV